MAAIWTNEQSQSRELHVQIETSFSWNCLKHEFEQVQLCSEILILKYAIYYDRFHLLRVHRERLTLMSISNYFE